MTLQCVNKCYGTRENGIVILYLLEEHLYFLAPPYSRDISVIFI